MDTLRGLGREGGELDVYDYDPALTVVPVRVTSRTQGKKCLVTGSGKVSDRSCKPFSTGRS